MSATRCPIVRRKVFPDATDTTDYHDWTLGTGFCRFCGASRADANCAVDEHRPALADALAARAARRAARGAKLKALAGKRAGHWLKVDADNRERRAREQHLRRSAC